jgi:choline dehydrogenase-like flavoprotein
MLTTNEIVDVIVIGSGAGGSAATYRLARAGLRVLLVEKGVPLPKDGSTLDVQRVIHDGEFKSAERWSDAAGRAFAPEEHFNLGGKTKWYGAALARFGAAEFASDHERAYLRWPFGYDELAPYYDEIEALLGVRRFECEPDLAAILTRLGRASGWRAEPLPLGLDSRILSDRHEAAHFDGFASARGLKADGEGALLARVDGAPNLRVLTGRAVAALVGAPGAPERIFGVRLDDGTELRAREVVLAAGAMHSPRLLQRYLSSARLEHLPIAKIAGGNFKLHLLTAVIAFSRSKQRDLLRKTMLLSHDSVPHSSVQPLGFDGELIATLIPRFVPRALARLLGARAYGFFLQTEDGSSLANRVRAADATDEHPRVDYDARRAPAALAEHERLVKLFGRDLWRAGYPNAAQRIGLAGTAHACGTLVTGIDPRTSAVDPAGRVHGLRGLTVADGSVLPRSSRVNPALTIYAWSLRATELLARRLRAAEPRGAETVGGELADRVVDLRPRDSALVS